MRELVRERFHQDYWAVRQFKMSWVQHENVGAFTSCNETFNSFLQVDKVLTNKNFYLVRLWKAVSFTVQQLPSNEQSSLDPPPSRQWTELIIAKWFGLKLWINENSHQVITNAKTNSHVSTGLLVCALFIPHIYFKYIHKMIWIFKYFLKRKKHATDDIWEKPRCKWLV